MEEFFIGILVVCFLFFIIYLPDIMVSIFGDDESSEKNEE